MCSRSMSVSVSLRLSTTTTTRATTTTRRKISRSFNSAPSSFSRGGGKKRCLRRRTVVASVEDNTNNGDESSLVNTAHAITSSTPYAVLEGVVVLAILALLDCGWSGDWSRIGAVTQENEAQARWLCVNVVFPAHCVTALVTYSVEDSEEDKVKNGFKSFLVGGLTMIKALAEREKRKASER